MLSPRLQAVAAQICAPVHADIGTDHAKLPCYLLDHGRVERIIAVEKHPGPYARACRALQGYAAEVRRGDGLQPLLSAETNSLSITGMGALNIVHILKAYPDRLPARLVLQPMDECQPIRVWGLQYGYHLLAEHWVEPHTVLTFGQSPGDDPVYHDLPRAAALRFGPHLLRQPGLRPRLLSLRLWIEKHQTPHYFADLQSCIAEALEHCSD